MKLCTVITASTPLLFFPFATSAPLSNEGTRPIKVVYHTVDSLVSVKALSDDVVVAHACSIGLESAPFAQLPIRFNVDENGAGNLTVGSASYVVHENEEYSGGITCIRMYNQVETIISCTVPVPRDFSLPPLNDFDEHKCIPSSASSIIGALQTIQSLPGEQFVPSLANTTAASAEEKREVCTTRSVTRMIGDGNPHQNYFHKQLSENMFCGAASQCTAGHESSRSYEISWSVTSGAAASEWLSGGFAVTTSWSTGNNYECQAGTGQTVCVWYNTAHTAYTVQNGYSSTCTGDRWYGNNFVMFSPNQRNVGGGYYCVVGPCRSEGEGYWDYNGRAGGP